jgi:hypothetical protein
MARISRSVSRLSRPSHPLQPWQFHLPERYRRGVSVAYQRFGLLHEATPADFDTRTDGAGAASASPEFWEGLAAECEFVIARLQPRGFIRSTRPWGPRAQRAGRCWPRDIAQRALARVDRLSQRFGTRMVLEKDIATVQLD